MNLKQNALEIIRFGNPERIPPGPPTHEISYVGCHHEGYQGGGHHLPVGSQWHDIWGTGWYRELEGVMGFPREHPLADLPNAISSYPWPDPNDERICGRILEQAKGWDREATFLCGSHRDTLWEKCYMLVGMENLMVYFLTEPEAVRELMRRVMDFQIGIARHYLDAGVEMVHWSDDLGSQNGLLLSPEIVEDFFIPEYQRLRILYKKHDVIVDFHSCGHIEPALPWFLNLEVDILNPVQATANDLDALRRETQGRIALQGGVRSMVIMDGPAEAIRDEVKLRIRQLGRDGGYFCSHDQFMPYPEAHLHALWEAVEEFGRLPIEG